MCFEVVVENQCTVWHLQCCALTSPWNNGYLGHKKMKKVLFKLIRNKVFFKE